MTEDRRRHSRASPISEERVSGLDKVVVRSSLKPTSSKYPSGVAREAPRAVHCEIDGLPAELDRAELSSAGVFVLTPQPAKVDSEVSVFLRIEQQRFEMTGHVVQSLSCEQAANSGKKPGYALLFTNLTDAERRRLSEAALNYRAASAPPAGPANASGSAEVRSGPHRPVVSRPPPTPPGRRTIQFSHAGAPPRDVSRPAPSTTADDPAELALLQQLRGELALLADKTAWAVLGVSQGADPATIKAAFFQASKRYHPHRFARYAHPQIKRVVTELFIAHKRAYTTMTKVNKSSRTGRP